MDPEEIKRRETAQSAQLKRKSSLNIKSKVKKEKNHAGNKRTGLPLYLGESWDQFVALATRDVKTREIVNEEFESFINWMFNTLTDPKEDKLNIASIKSFFTNTILFAYKCEKQSWTIYLIIFMFNIFAQILVKAQSQLQKD